MPALQALDVLERGEAVEVKFERAADGDLGEFELAQSLELRGEGDAARAMRKKERLLAQPIARQKELVVVPNGHGEHAVEPLQARRPPLQVCRQYHLGVGGRLEAVPSLLQLTPKFEPVVD